MFFQSLIFFDGDIFSFELVLLSEWNCFLQLIHSLQGTQQQYSEEATKLVHLSPLASSAFRLALSKTVAQ